MKDIKDKIIQIIKSFLSAIILLIIVMIPVVFVIPAWAASLFGNNATSLLTNIFSPDYALIVLVVLSGFSALLAMLLSEKLVGEE